MRETGAHTVLLRSAPRPVIEIKPQYHEIDEEFVCPKGRFTFDGFTHFEPMSYVFFPAGTVHGAAVHVPEGDLLYLRNSGRADAHKVARPLSPTAYPHGAANADRAITLRAPPSAADWATTPSGALRRRLGAHAASCEGATLLRLPTGWSARPPAQPGYLEMYVLEGSVARSGRPLFGPGCYAYDLPGQEQPEIESDGALLLLHHGAPLTASASPTASGWVKSAADGRWR